MDSTVLVLVPDASYEAVTSDPHCTLAYFGKSSELEMWQKEILRELGSKIAEDYGTYSPMRRFYQTPPKVTGRAVFSLDPNFNDGNKFAFVDLVDWNVFPSMRALVEQKIGFAINRGHGFIPHITSAHSTSFIPDLVKPRPIYPIKWKSVELWDGDDHTVFELT